MGTAFKAGDLVEYHTGPLTMAIPFGRYRGRAGGWCIVDFGMGRTETKISPHHVRSADAALGKVCACYGSGKFYDVVELRQKGVDRFTVCYGVEIKPELSYARATQALGQALMHALACDSKIDNRERGER